MLNSLQIDNFILQHLLTVLSICWTMINGMFWNIRGVLKAPNFRRLLRLIHMHGVQFLAICKSKLDVSNIETIRLRLSFDYVMVNLLAGLWIFISP